MKQNDSGPSFLNPLNTRSSLKISNTFKEDLKTLLKKESIFF